VRYRAVSRDPKENPFKPKGVTRCTQTVDIDAAVSVEQVTAWAKESAEQAGYEFVELKVIGDDGLEHACAA
jgi:hypothetical protein